MSEHEMHYRAGSDGFVHLGVPDDTAHWYCMCMRWRFEARPNVTRKTGNNKIEAERSFKTHQVTAYVESVE